MKKFISYTLLVLLIACAEKEPTAVPAGVLNKEIMKDVIVDLQLADAGYRFHHYEKQVKTFDPTPLYDKIYQKHNTSKEQFETSLKFYTSEPDLLSEIYASVLSDLLKIQAEQARK